MAAMLAVQEAGVKPNEYTYSLLLSGYARRCRPRRTGRLDPTTQVSNSHLS